jgi:hypothetical protein
VRREKIAILALQETHLNARTTYEVQNAFTKRLHSLNSEDERSPTTSAGVAFVLNIHTSHLRTFELISGQALALKIKWNEQAREETNIINIYSPLAITGLNTKPSGKTLTSKDATST